MIFDFKSIHEIKDAEIATLVTDGIRERQHLEYKARFDNRDDVQQLELLRDIASFANSGGGYLIELIPRIGKARKETRFFPSGLGRMSRFGMLLHEIFSNQPLFECPIKSVERWSRLGFSVSWRSIARLMAEEDLMDR